MIDVSVPIAVLRSGQATGRIARVTGIPGVCRSDWTDQIMDCSTGCRRILPAGSLPRMASIWRLFDGENIEAFTPTMEGRLRVAGERLADVLYQLAKY